MVTFLPQIVGVSAVTATVVILKRQLAGEDGIILKYFVVVAGRRQIRGVEVGITVMKLDAWELVFVEVDVNSRDFKWWIGDDNKELLDDVSSCELLPTNETLVNHWLEFVQHIVVLTFREFLCFPP